MNKLEFKKALKKATGGCTIQHDGWTCGTCFFSIGEGLNKEDMITNADWQSVLYYRGDTKKEDLENLPEDWMKNIERIWEIIGDSK